ncbi:uncharacterized protein LOC126833815 [Adelges cooleyi]|uniref:uncharacterized protein LOC126833815 n=1 Tax=Adelges cooleyi TaxID=133065 RepID=UPI00217F6A2B|nr:uncharacterized protein LOC126833815 [Adelges cooleyi]
MNALVLSNDSLDNDVDSAKVLWTNGVPITLVETLPVKRVATTSESLFDAKPYYVPHGLSRTYMNRVTKLAEDIVSTVVSDAEWVANDRWKSCKAERLKFKDSFVHNAASFVKQCRDKVQLPKSSKSCSPATLYLFNVFRKKSFNDRIVMDKIAEHIKYEWKLDPKYLYTIDKTKVATEGLLTKHCYKAEFSVPTKEYPVPQLTVSVFFTVETSATHSRNEPIFIEYSFETEMRVYVLGKDWFRRRRFEQLFERKLTIYKDINRYVGWYNASTRFSKN